MIVTSRYILNHIASLTLDCAVLDTEELSLVVTRDCGVRVNVAWQHRQFLGQIVHLHAHFSCPFDLSVV